MPNLEMMYSLLKIEKIKKMYAAWLAENYAKFYYKPYIAAYECRGKKQHMIIQFEHIPHMSFRIDSSGHAGMFVYECQRYWDIVFECDMVPVKTEDGKHYCTLCNEYRKSQGKKLKFWNSSYEMWSEHTFDAMLKWCNANHDPLNVIVCCGVPEETSHSARIVPIAEKSDYGEYSMLLPVVNSLCNL